ASAALVERREDAHPMRVAVQLVEICGDTRALGAEPRAGPDTIPGVDGPVSLRAEIRAPCSVAVTRRLGERLAVRVGAFEPAEVSALARPDARHEERHRPGRRLSQRSGGAEQ